MNVWTLRTPLAALFVLVAAGCNEARPPSANLDVTPVDGTDTGTGTGGDADLDLPDLVNETDAPGPAVDAGPGPVDDAGPAVDGGVDPGEDAGPAPDTDPDVEPTPDADEDAGPAPDTDLDAGPSPDTEDDADLDAGPGPDTPEPFCGDGRVDPGEECDDGASNADDLADACRLDCTLPVCGDGVVDSDEACDDGVNDEFDGCDATCRAVAATPCAPCTNSSDCGRSIDVCQADPATGESVCWARCRDNADCPDGFTCEATSEGRSFCEPESGTCADCIDEDGDGWGIGSDCLGPDCNDDDASVNPGAAEICGDGIDNDCNGRVDCDDPACAAACEPPTCVDASMGSGTGVAVATGTTLGAGDDETASCGGAGSPDVVLQYTAASDATYIFRSAGSLFPTTLSLRTDCDGEELACSSAPGSADASVRTPLSAGESVLLVVDGQARTAGQYAIAVLRSEAGFCDDGVDNDGNGRADCADAACALDAACCPDDVFEPNRGTAEAPSTLYATYLENADAELTVRTDAPDFFNLPVCRGAQISARAEFSHAGGDINLALLAPQGFAVAQANSTTDNESLSFSIPNLPGTPARLFLRVTNATPASCNTYRLTIRVTGC